MRGELLNLERVIVFMRYFFHFFFFLHNFKNNLLEIVRHSQMHGWHHWWSSRCWRVPQPVLFLDDAWVHLLEVLVVAAEGW